MFFIQMKSYLTFLQEEMFTGNKTITYPLSEKEETEDRRLVAWDHNIKFKKLVYFHTLKFFSATSSFALLKQSKKILI